MHVTVNGESEPESLVDQCIKYLLNNIDKFAYESENTYKLWNQDVRFPRELSEKLIDIYQRSGGIVNDKLVDTFLTKEVTNLKRIKLRNAKLSGSGLQKLLKHKVRLLDLNKCTNTSKGTLNLINTYSENLYSLSVGPQCDILPKSMDEAVRKRVCKRKPDFFRTFNHRGYLFRVPKLRHFSLIGQNFIGSSICCQIPKDMPYLTHLNLSCSTFDSDVLSSLKFLTQFKQTLASLVLFNVSIIKNNLSYICSLTNLRRLDISTSLESPEYSNYSPNPNDILSFIVHSLPNLVSLDISGTNLAGRGVFSEENNSSDNTSVIEDYYKSTDIPGLASRVKRPLEFLGLYGTKHGASNRHDIPALKIAGDCNESQLLVAAEVYIERPEMLQQVLNDLYHIFRYDTCVNVEHALTVVLEALDNHLTEKHIQISGSANLFYIVKMKDRPQLSSHTKRHIISTLLNGMHTHPEDETMMRNGCLTLCQFKIPQDVQFDYERLVKILLHIIAKVEHETSAIHSGFVLRIAIYLLNSLACQVDNYHKRLLGELGVIKKMLKLIKERIEQQECDDILEVAWSAMWNVTDETAINCERFLDNKGMELFLDCLQIFPEKDELLRNMMGLLGNVAEVDYLRPRLMTSKFIEVFANLVSSKSDGIEVSYNAAGVLSHIASDGPEFWTIRYPSREKVLSKMVEAIDMWPLESERNINYRSFEPIMQLLKVYHTPECQHWSVWALANLTKVYPEKYCRIVESEGGIQLLKELIDNVNVNIRIKNLARLVIKNCETQIKNRVLYNMEYSIVFDTSTTTQPEFL